MLLLCIFANNAIIYQKLENFARQITMMMIGSVISFNWYLSHTWGVQTNITFLGKAKNHKIRQNIDV